MDLTTLATKLTSLKSSNTKPSNVFWPKYFYFNKDIASQLTKMAKWTDEDHHEYETSVFWADGELVATPLIRGTKHNVNARHSAGLRYSPVNTNSYYKEIFLDEKLFKKRYVSKSTIKGPPKIEFVTSIHTHPKEIGYGGKKTYSFFSTQDIRTLLSSSAMFMGVFSDALWFACKTNATIKQVGEIGDDILFKLSQKSYSGMGNIEKEVVNDLNRFGLVFYKGFPKSKIYRIN